MSREGAATAGVHCPLRCCCLLHRVDARAVCVDARVVCVDARAVCGCSCCVWMLVLCVDARAVCGCAL